MSSSNQTSRILKLGVDEIFEDLTYNIAYNEILSRMRNNGMPDGILKEAINSGISIMFSAALMLYIQKQEKVLERIISAAAAAIIALLSPLKSGVKKLLRGKRGRKLIRFIPFLKSSTQDNIAMAGVVASSANSVFSSRNVANTTFERSNASIAQIAHIRENKNQELNYAKAKADSINQTLLFKLFTSKFTPADKEILRRITGSSDIDVEQINKVASFMFVLDEAGNITGLSEQFLMLLNGLGYFKAKGVK